MPAIEKYDAIRTAIEYKLLNGLSKDLFYHSLQHTTDVILQSERIAHAEKITDPEDLFLLKVAGLYHDNGYLFTYKGHEEVGCTIANEELPAYGLNNDQIDIVCGLIMATKVPQVPLTKMQEIICDADLDYLGRDDFFASSNQLFLELKALGAIHNVNEWNILQVKFLSGHSYFTDINKKTREPQKQEHIKMIKAMIKPV